LETTRITQYYLEMRYGSAVRVEYVDMADPQNQAQFPELVAVVEDRDLPYPLIAVNGDLRAAGSAHYHHLLPLVEHALGVEELVHET
jgi:disulfide oxidoreductase YuzD